VTENNTANQLVTIAKRLLDAPLVPSRNGAAYEFIAQSYTFIEPDPGFVILGRGMSERIRVVEMLTLCGQWDVSHRMPEQFNRFKDDALLRGAYGQRLYGQLTKIADELYQDPGSRRAVVTIYDGHRDLLDHSHDIPCTLSIQFLIRSDTLWAVANMRSSDAFLGLPYDVAQFTALGHAVATAMDVPFAGLTINCGSSHLYEKDAETVRALTTPGTMPTRWPRLWPAGSTIGDIMELSRRVLECKYSSWTTPFLQEAHNIITKGNE
jgi:hypothetical protein